MSVPSDDQKRVERVLTALLRPVSKILIKYNISLNTSVELIKRTLVEAAVDDSSPTDSLVSLRTGVHRKDVKRLRALMAEGGAENPPIRGLAVVLSLWANDPRFRDGKGQPRSLARKARDGVAGFDDLVRASKVDLAPATVLQELLAQSLVAMDAEGRITLLSKTFVAQSGEAALRAFEATVTDHVRVAAENVLSPPGAPRKFDQVVRYSHLSDASVAALEAEARKLARNYLEHMNAMAHRLQSDDDASGQLSNGQFVSGVFIAPGSAGQRLTGGHVTPDPEKDKDP